ncbi:Isopropyl malate synthase AMT7, partial [Pseudocercospora fuligena]
IAEGAMYSNTTKYRSRAPTFRYRDRTWPDTYMSTSPVLFSTDLRDGNQALPHPFVSMPYHKLRLFKLLVSIGFKEIEVGYPCANQEEFDFIRYIIETPGIVPNDVLIQVITPCREDAISRAVESLHGAKQAILLTYLPSSDNYRDTILQISEDEWIDRAQQITKFARSVTKDSTADDIARKTHWTFGFGYEDFPNARMDAVARCAETVLSAWGATKDDQPIVCIASSVECASPNVFADQVEYLARRLSGGCKNFRLSVHTHNDRGGAISSAELACLGGADRVEGCLFGNGERAGNLDLVTFALNMLTQGLDPGVDFSDLDNTRALYEDLTKLKVSPRAPYAGTYYLRAFSGAHQDAIWKGIQRRNKTIQEQGQPWSAGSVPWNVPYLPIDPADIGRSLDDVVGINSQSGKRGVAWVIRATLGKEVPNDALVELSNAVKARSIELGRELSADEVCRIFLVNFVPASG